MSSSGVHTALKASVYTTLSKEKTPVKEEGEDFP